jgi:hypothetical protein
MITTNAHEISIERGRLWIVLATIVINIVAVSLLRFAPWSDWRTGAALNVVDNCLLVGFVLFRSDVLFARFLLLDSWSASLSYRLTPGWSITRVR